MHKGIDFAADHGADVTAPADGLVIFVGNRGGYGKAVVIDHGYGIQTHYGHLSGYRVEIGQRVKRGQIVAAVGNTGRSTGTHLHYEVRYNGIPQDPEKYILD
jgi:murein DD-endopeptidase MepM/ murein hydrolase activator NlpD